MHRSRPPSDSSFYRRYAWVIFDLFLASLPLCALFAAWAMQSNRNNVKEWLPDSFEATQDVKWFHARFPGEGFVLVTWEGCNFNDPRLPAFKQALLASDPGLDAANNAGSETEGVSPWFRNVRTGPDLVEQLMAPPSKLTRAEAMLRLEGLFVSQGERKPAKEGMLDEEAQWEEEKLRLADLKQSGDQRLTCALVTLAPAGSEHLRKAVYQMRDTALALGRGENPNPALQIEADALKMGGPPIDNVALDEAGEKSLHRLILLSFGVGIFICWWCFRNFQLVAYVIATGAYAMMMSLALVYLTGGTVNAILLTMPSLVYVAATSGAIHLTNYYRETVLEHGVRGAPLRAVRHALLPLGLATGTTAVGLATLCISQLLPIRQFGFYSAIGVVSTLWPLLVVLPAAFELWPLKQPRTQPNAAGEQKLWVTPIERLPWNNVGRWIIDHYVAVLVAVAVMMGVFGYGVTQCQTSIHLMRFFDKESEIVQNYEWLERNIGPLVPMEVILRIDEDSKLSMLERMELVERVQKRIEAHPEVGSSLSALTFAPSLPGGEGYSIRRSTWSKRLELHKDELIGSDYLRVDHGTELWRISARVGSLNFLDYGQFIHELQSEVDPIIADLKADKENLILETKYTGLIPLIYKAQHSLLSDLVWGFMGDWFTIAVAMMVAVRAWSAGMLLMLPSVFPAVVVFGYMGLGGILVDIGTVMTPAVALGVTVDDVVHFMLRFRDSLKQGENRREAIMDAYRGTAQAMYQSWGIIGLGLSVYALSPFMPTQRFGAMMIALLTASLFGNLVLLPALLASPLGWIFSHRIERQRRRREESIADRMPLGERSNKPAREAAAVR